MQDIEQTIRDRAYHLWLESGCQDGNADGHWLAAQREVLGASLGELGHLTKSAKAAKSKAVGAPRKKKRAA
jgi:Protein of unknown function (DUF2934)